MFAAWCGDLEAVSAIIAEDSTIKDVIGNQWYSAAAVLHAGYRGRPEEDLAYISASGTDSTGRGDGQGSQMATWTQSHPLQRSRPVRRCAGCGGAGSLRDGDTEHDGVGADRADRSRGQERAAGKRPRSAAATVQDTIDGSDWAAGIEARSRALVTEGRGRRARYIEAVERLARTPLRTELARAQLVYGEWLRREGRRVDAREHLGAAYELFAAMRAEGFAERTRRELQATGEKVRKRNLNADTNELTPQEAHIARLAWDGRSNAEIGAELFLSVRTVEWHLRKVFAKLGITSRRDLKEALSSAGRDTRPSHPSQT